MRAIRFLLILVILLIATPGYAGLRNPHEIVEDSSVDTTAGDSTWTENVTSKVKTWVSDKVDTVKTWTGKEPVPAVAMPTKPQPQAERPATVDAKPVVTPAPVVNTTIQDVRKRLNAEGVSSISKPGRKAQGKFKMTKAGVPVFPMAIEKIPRLDVGLEPTISRNDFLTKDYHLPITEVADVPALPSPKFISDAEVKAVSSKPVIAAIPAQDLQKQNFGIDQIVTRESILSAVPKMKAVKQIQEKPYKELSPTQQAMLTALILYNKGDRCHAVLGLFDQLTNEQRFANEATFLLGTCAAKLKMRSLSFERLSSLVRAENKEFGAESLSLLIQDLPAEYEVQFSKLIRDLKDKKLIPETGVDEVNYLAAKGAFKEGVYQEARTFAEKVTEASPRYGNAQFLIGLSWYSLGNTTKAIGKLETLRQWMTAKGKTDKNLNSLSAVNLARMRFQQGKFKDAHALYMAIDKDHPVWVQGLIEQGWAQLAMDDFSGAIGNMYSLHSPYFKTVYKPQSFVVRTIGYLNICQYGDAYRTLSWLESEYRPWSDAISSYVTRKKLASDYYETTREYLKGKSDADQDGLPFQVVREMARQREFLNHQTSLNEKADETGRYDTVEKQMLEERAALKSRVAKATARFNEAKGKIGRAAKDSVLATQIDQIKQQQKLERETVIGLRHHIEMIDQSRKAYQALKTQMTQRIDKEKYVLREKAGRNLAETLIQLKGEMALVLENNEFLRYEVFAGSGENIRYQVAGGQVAEANRVPASIKPSKSMNWSFDGEYWEDEIGSYRSSLRNNCPQLGKMDQFFKDKESAEAAEKGQAAIEKGVGR